MNDAASLALIVIVGLLTGCSQSGSTTTSHEPQDRVEKNSVVVTTVDRAEFDAVLVSLQGKVVLVDCWATWCMSCLEQLPHSLELASLHKDAGIEVVTLSFDNPDMSKQIGRILYSKGGNVRGTHYVSNHGGSSRSMDEFQITGGALPHYKLYDRSGKLRRTFELDPSAAEQFSTADIDEAVSKLLSERS